jgi:hypothetical protein
MSEQPGLFSAIFVPFVDAANERSRQRRMMRQQQQQQPLTPAEQAMCRAVAGFVALIAGLRESRVIVPQNLLAAFFSASVLLGIAWLLLAGIFPADATGGYIVRGLYVTGLAAAAVSLWIQSGLAQGNALRTIQRHRASRKATRCGPFNGNSNGKTRACARCAVIDEE